LQVFSNDKFGAVRTLEENGKVLLCGSDVARALGYHNPSRDVKRHCKHIVPRCTTDPVGRHQEMLFIPEGDVYRLITRSKLPAAEEFESWVFDEVLPSIRKTGGYIAGQDELNPEELMAKALVVANRTLAERDKRIACLTVQNQIMAPKAEYFDELVERNLLTNFRDTAKELHVGPKKFVSFLLAKKYIYRDKKGKLLPHARHCEDGLFEVKECYNETTEWSGTQTLITPKGREVFRLLMTGCTEEDVQGA